MPKILLAEDDATMLSLLKTLLKLEGFDSSPLGDQEDVLDAIRREKPDLVLLDVNLPQGNGMDFLRRVRQDAELKKVIIIMSSGMPYETECLEAGANAFLLKPYMPDVLIGAIKSKLTAARA
jgi:DNA-binding response OmpR family regulator